MKIRPKVGDFYKYEHELTIENYSIYDIELVTSTTNTSITWLEIFCDGSRTNKVQQDSDSIEHFMSINNRQKLSPLEHILHYNELKLLENRRGK